MYIQIKKVSKTFKKIKALHNISLDIPKGQFLALLGPNGAGKTTIVELIEGIQMPDSGSITINTLDWKQHANKLRKMLGICLQETQYMEKVTVYETIQLFADIYQTPKKEIDHLIKIFKLKGQLSQYALSLSGGQRQKLSLMLGLMNNPDVLILDEPTTGLDPIFRREIWTILAKYKDKGLTLILTTHYMEEAEFLCDYVVLMNKGKIIKKGTKTELLSSLKARHKITLEINEKETTPQFPNTDLFKNLIWDKKLNTVTINTNNPSELLITLLNILKEQKFTIKNLAIKHNTLEDVFINLTGEKLDD